MKPQLVTVSCERAGDSFQLPKSKAISAVWMSAWILPPWRSLQHRSCKMPCHHLIARWSLHLPKEVSFQQLGSGNSSLSSYLCRLMAHVDLNLKFQNSIPKACTSRALFAHTLLFRRSNSKLCSCQIHLGSHCTPTKA